MNPPHQLITVGVDGSPASDAALVYALDEAAARGARVLAVTAWWVGPVLPDSGSSALATRRAAAASVQASAIARACAEIDDPPTVLTRLAHGDPSVMLIDAARHTSCLVIGTEHKSIFRRVTEGSVSARCVRNCAVPVIVVPWIAHPKLQTRGIDLDIDLEAELELDADRPVLETLTS